MRICILSSGDSLDKQVEPRFGRARFLVIVDTESGKLENIENPLAANQEDPDLPQKTATFILQQKVDVLLAGNCDENIKVFLEQKGLAVHTGITGTIMNAIAAYKAGKL